MNISKQIVYIGTDDLDIDLFEGQYVVPEGMSYNSYLIKDEKIAVMDSVDHRKCAEWLQNLENALEGAQPDYIVVHHLEPDHAGSLAEVTAKYPEMQLVMSQAAAKMLPQFYADRIPSERIIAVSEGDTLALGVHTLHFVMAPMVHWPEVMVSYESLEKVLFAADGFGKFGAICNETDDWKCEARRYYFNIVGKYGQFVQKLLKKAAGLDIAVIAPLHGPVLKEDVASYVEIYDIWSSGRAEDDGVFVAYASIHGNTAVAAHKMAELLKAAGVEKVVVSDLCRCDIHEAVEDAFRYSKAVFAASTYDAGIFTPMYNFLHLLQAKAYQNRKVGLIENGSWAPAAAKCMKEMLSGLKDVEIVGQPVSIRSTVKSENIAEMQKLAEALA
ncbi:MAG: FprA family A-type flavoprotein [Bacteroidales bacterium]|nr:FprA family A-type flavoprotein [Bacteroidales bacterium]